MWRITTYDRYPTNMTGINKSPYRAPPLLLLFCSTLYAQGPDAGVAGVPREVTAHLAIPVHPDRECGGSFPGGLTYTPGVAQHSGGHGYRFRHDAGASN